MGHIDHVGFTFATTGYVDERVKKLEERIEALEAKLARQDLREFADKYGPRGAAMLRFDREELLAKGYEVGTLEDGTPWVSNPDGGPVVIDDLAPYRREYECSWDGDNLNKARVQSNLAHEVMKGAFRAFNDFGDTCGRFRWDKVYRFTLTFTEEDPHEEAQP